MCGAYKQNPFIQNPFIRPVSATQVKMARSVLVLLLVVLTSSVCQEFVPVTVPAVVSQGRGGVCLSAEESAAIREQITEQILANPPRYTECCQVCHSLKLGYSVMYTIL